MFCYVLDCITLVVHGHGRGTHLDTCLVQQLCVSCAMAFVACVNVSKCSVMFLISLHWLCTGMDEARTLVHALCSSNVSRVPWPLLHASMLVNVLLCSSFYEAGCAQAWTRHSPWYMPCAAAVCLMPWPLLRASPPLDVVAQSRYMHTHTTHSCDMK